MVGGGVHQAPVAVGNNAGSMVTIVKTNAKRTMNMDRCTWEDRELDFIV